MINSLDIDKIRKSFVTAEPYPHVVIDDFLQQDIAQKILNEFPTSDSDIWGWKSNDMNSIKQMCQDTNAIKTLPNIWSSIEFLNSESFLEQVAKFTEMPKLYGDSEFSGGGLHLIKRGGHLKLHVDFNIADSLPDLNRRLNIILFMNPDWKSEWGGGLELWNTDCTECVVTVKPIFNRAVIFDTQPKNGILPWHGHPLPLQCPEEVHRKSIALYYYSKETPETNMSKKHKTIYKG